ncbi:MAG TPA: hypothetical protein VIG99_33535 [Myxococcaceae bacterium]|jgi:putative addiction module component (TIGR02574 family)
MSMRDEVLERALDLEVSDREELVRQLAQSLGLGLEEEDGDDDFDFDEEDPELEAEFMRRMEEYDSGLVKGIPGDEAFRRLEEKERRMPIERQRKKGH